MKFLISRLILRFADGYTAFYPAYQVAQQIDMIGQQRPLAFQQVHREEIAAARDKISSIIRHYPSQYQSV